MKGRKAKAIVVFFALLIIVSLVVYWGAYLLRGNMSASPEYSDMENALKIGALDSLFVGCSISLLIVLLVYGVYRPVIVLFIYLSVQILCSIPLSIVYKLAGEDMGSASLSSMLLVSSVITVVVLYFAHYARIEKHEISTNPQVINRHFHGNRFPDNI